MKISRDKKIINDILTRGVENVFPTKAALEQVLLSGKKIRLYCGYDPNSPVLHIGHGITVRKLAKFLELGHEVVFLFGDFTAQIGDPDKLSVRKPLTHAQVLKNLKGWKQQIKNIIDVKKVRFEFNSKWLAKLTFKDLIEAAHHFTGQQMMDREMFQERIRMGRPVYLHEFFYPLMQAYDSVAMDVDLEVGGNDQMFNMLCGRTLMKAMKNKEKFVLTTKLLEDPTGKKMGKSEGNMITLADSPENMYGKVMSWPDGMIVPGFEILTEIDYQEKEKQLKSGANPRDLKMELAQEVVRIYQGEKAARHAEMEFRRVFQEKQKPVDMPEVAVADKDGKIGVLDLFVSAGLAQSNGEARRLIKEGALLVDDEKVTNEKMELVIPSGGFLLQRGKKMFKRVVKK